MRVRLSHCAFRKARIGDSDDTIGLKACTSTDQFLNPADILLLLTESTFDMRYMITPSNENVYLSLLSKVIGVGYMLIP